MPTVTFNGIDTAAVVASAKTLAVGAQKARYCQQIVALLGANPIVQILVNSVVVYQSTITGSLPYGAAGIGLPAAFIEPPSINVANAVTAASSYFVIRSASNASVYVQIPVKAGGDGGVSFLTLGSALDGTKLVRDGGVVLRPPADLDVSTGTGGGTGGGNTTMNDAAFDVAFGVASGTYNRVSAAPGVFRLNELPYHGIPFGTYAWPDHCGHGMGHTFRRLETMNSHMQPLNGVGGWTDSMYFNVIDPWMVFSHAQGANGGVGIMEVKRVSLQVLKKSTNQWHWIFKDGGHIGWSPKWSLGPNNGTQGQMSGNYSPVHSYDENGYPMSTLQIDAGTTANGGVAACHFTFGDIWPSKVAIDGSDVKDFCLSALVRRGTNSPSNHTGLVHIGLDPKIDTNGTQPWNSYYENAALSCSIVLRNNWAPIYAAPWKEDLWPTNRVYGFATVNARRPMYPFD